KEIPVAKPGMLFLVPLFLETFSKTIWRTARKQGQEEKLKKGMKLSNALMKVGIDRRQELFKDVLKKFGGNLECIICGGAPLDPRYVKEFRSWGIHVLNGYGITECAPVLSVNRNQYWRDGSVGQLVPGISFRVYDKDEHGIGEIQVKGDNVMMGYYNNPEATEEAFLDGWYRTGDLGYIDKDGFLFITGRAKNLIILNNGENVSPEEIEQNVERIPEVGEVVVFEEDGAITAEIFPDDTDERPEEEKRKIIEEAIKKLNSRQPNFKKIHKIKFRKTPFEKTATRKIKRYQVGKHE
ncbi:MAG: AMP-binding protein, partial [Candidatus Onthomonas sp.]|nr:AMP-binding protein [Candidatus Onthomonas sp.]